MNPNSNGFEESLIETVWDWDALDLYGKINISLQQINKTDKDCIERFILNVFCHYYIYNDYAIGELLWYDLIDLTNSIIAVSHGQFYP